jgi:hypothetical protein
MTQEALKLALEALERFEGNKKLWPEAITAIKEALAQTQEPVAWVSEDVCKGQYIDGRPRKIWWECNKGVGTAFYTTPPQRTWVDLTDEEIFETHKQVDSMQYLTFANAIEAKLKELNT